MLVLLLATTPAGPLAAANAIAAGSITESPLAPRAAPRGGATMFTSLAAADTGVVTENSYADPRMWAERYQEFSVGAIGTGLAAADYDNDGRPDLFVINKTGPAKLFRNLGQWKFADVTASAGLAGPTSWVDTVKGWFGAAPPDLGDTIEAWKQGAAFADINNDGWLDLYVCRMGAPNWLFVNQGDGTFREAAAAHGLAIVDGSCMAAFCDYDRDGWLDAYLQTNLLDFNAHPQGQPDRLLRNNGDGTFRDVTDAAGIRGNTQGHSVTWWDYDEDGWPDVYVANDFAAGDSLYRNNRDGTFTDVAHRTVPHTPYSAMGSDLGDVNNDGRIDLFVADMAATSHEKDQRGMADSRARSKDPVDGATVAPQLLRNALYLATGTGRCLEAAELCGLAATDWTWSTRWEDFDNDGRLDLHVTNGMNREFHNADFIQNVMMTERLAERMRLPRESAVLSERNLAYRNLGDLRFESVGPAWGLDQPGVSYGAVTADFDGDGDLDLAVSNLEAGVSLFRNDAPAGHRVVIALRGTRSNRFGVGATVRMESASGVQVRQLVVARGYLSSSEPVLHFGLGDDPVIQRLTITWPSALQQVFHDLAVDRRYTITEPDQPAESAPAPAREPAAPTCFVETTAAANLVLAAPEETIEESNQQPLLPFRFNRRGPALAVGDVNGDGHDDVLLGGTCRTPAQLALGEAGGRFRAPTPAWPAAGATLDDGPILLFDADGDGRPDVLQTRAGTNYSAGAVEYQPKLWLNDGRGSFRAAGEGALPPLPISVGAVAAVDFDRDGRLDVFLGARVLPGSYPRPPRSALLANRGGGRFEDVTDALAPALRSIGMVTSALWTDVDDDGWSDLLLALDWGTVRCLRNDGGRGFSDWSEQLGFAAAGSGLWTALAGADCNGDGRLDYVAGNHGLNTPYRASPSAPAVILLGAFRGGGSLQLVEAYHEDGALYPRRNRKDLGAQIPSILRRFPRNNDYAKATLPEILGEKLLAAAERYEVTELRSGVFLSRGDGTYAFTPLPRLAQIAPVQGIATGDFDGDGHLDVLAAQNCFAPVPSTGRFDGGLSQLLRGDGRGGFEAVPACESGLVVAGDANAVAVLDRNGDGCADLLITRNHEPLLAFDHQPQPGRRGLGVQLRGPAGNPTAIGARVTLERADGSRKSLEVAAGAGYYSQSAPALFFGYTEENPGRKLHVRWPSGKSTRHDVPAGAPAVTLTAP